MKKRLEERPPVEKMKRRRTVFSIKKFTGPPRLKFILLRIETKRKIKIKKPIKGIVYWENSVFSQTKTRRNEPRIKSAC